ncbi:hypothetical protein DFJ74DRAFT_641839 [Hyaloraphidium curvatum]|nr:hypothetical protein DFJ74DRAFT_641839 [Hyaloraphidium curvatum]
MQKAFCLPVLAALVLVLAAAVQVTGQTTKASLAVYSPSDPAPAKDPKDLDSGGLTKKLLNEVALRRRQVIEKARADADGVQAKDHSSVGGPDDGSGFQQRQSCPVGSFRCSATTCNPSGTVCCSRYLRSSATGGAGDGQYCPGGTTCGPPGDPNCYRDGSSSACPAGTSQCSATTCNPFGSVCCSDGQYCPGGTTCGPPGDPSCYRNGAPEGTVFNAPPSPPAPPKGPSPGIIAIAVVVPVLVIAAAAITTWLLCRRRRQRAGAEMAEADSKAGTDFKAPETVSVTVPAEDASIPAAQTVTDPALAPPPNEPYEVSHDAPPAYESVAMAGSSSANDQTASVRRGKR